MGEHMKLDEVGAGRVADGCATKLEGDAVPAGACHTGAVALRPHDKACTQTTAHFSVSALAVNRLRITQWTGGTHTHLPEASAGLFGLGVDRHKAGARCLVTQHAFVPATHPAAQYSVTQLSCSEPNNLS